MATRIPASRSTAAVATPKLSFNADAFAIVIALTLAALIRLNVIPHIGW